MGCESIARRSPETTKAEKAGIIIDTIIGGTGTTARKMAIDMSHRKSIAIDPDLGTNLRMQAAKISGGAETNRITIDPPRDAEENE